MALRTSAIAVGTVNSDTVTVTDPGSVAGDQLCFVVFAGGSQTRTLSTVPTGFTLISSGFIQGSHNGAGDSWFAAYAGTTQSASYTVTISGANGTTPIICFTANSNRNTLAAPSNFTVTSDTGGNNGGNSPVTVTLTGVTALAGDDLLYFPVMNNYASWSFTAPAGFTNRQTAGANPSNSDKGAINFQSKDNASAGATGNIVSTATGINSDFGGIVIALPVFSVLVSGHGGSYTGTSTTYVLTEPAPTNDLIVVQWVLDNVSSAITPTISDSVNTGNYTQIGSTYYESSATKSFGQHYMPCNATGTPVITINGGVSSNNGQYVITHFTEFTSVPTLDANPAPVTGTNSTFTNSITTLFAPEVTMSSTFSDSSISGTPSGWTSTFSGGNGKICQPFYAYQTTTSTYTFTPTLAASAFYYNWTFSFYSGGVGTTLTAANGAFVLTGQAAALNLSQLIPFVMLSNPGAFDWIGAQAQIEAQIYNNTGTFTLTGIPATFQNSTGAAFTMAAAFGSFALTGINVVLQTPTYLMSELAGIFTLTGLDANFVLVTTPTNYETLPNLVGLDWIGASAVLWYGGYAELNPEIVKGTPIQMQQGIVVGQTPSAFTQVPMGCAVTLSVASSNLLSVSFEAH